MSLRWRLCFAFVLSVLLVQVTLAWWTDHRFARDVANDQTMAASASAHRLAAVLATPAWTLDKPQINEVLLAEFSARHDLESIRLVLDSRQARVDRDHDGVQWDDAIDSWGADEIAGDLIHPARLSVNLGSVGVTPDRRQSAKRLYDHRRDAAIQVIAVTVIVALLSTLLVHHTMLNRFRPLIADLDRAPETRSHSRHTDEIGRLADGTRVLLARLIAILDAIGDGVVTIDDRAHIERANPAANALLPALTTDQPLAACSPGDQAWEGLVAAIIDTAITARSTFATQHHHVLTSETGQRLVHVHAHPMGSRGAVVVIRDVTNEETRRNQLQQTEKLESIGRLAGGIAHDSNNVLTAIMGAASSLQRSALDAKQARLIEVVLTCCEQAGDFNRKLLAFARQEDIHLRRIDLREIVEQAVTLLQHALGRSHPIVATVPDHAVLVDGDRASLVNAVINLGINARDAMGDQGSIQITLDSVERVLPHPDVIGELPLGACARIRVADQGPGIPDEIRAHIFEPFFTTKPAGKGTGLGLSAVLGSIQMHHGAILVTNEHPGSNFTIHLPQVAAGDDPSSGRFAAVKSPVILVADDDEAVRELIEHFLGEIGVTVLAAEDGVHAVQMVNEAADRLSLVILDVRMPNLDGAQTWARIREAHPHLRCIFISGYSGDIELDADGVVGFLQKPFDFTRLQETVARHLGIPPTSR
jgi:signal transduction histidine kinase